ncbi:alkyl hydroperoxide reductase subunit AhpF [Pseudomonas nitritireducens]|uniref:Alkyl hydroperoxide reductase subunit AhpF n=1 Tax=Pseudomonas nitroreducens TaxID=46680 RepID=A0A7W7KI61_PSENT|nr:thioredoxin family protein [Pseudomonas nitritireducens]MBB4863247.1 alkyl hydroperoxide reductase subunit AhpF [Pseudomonas nitritireducens]
MASFEELFSIGEGFDAFVAHGLPGEIAGVRQVQQRLAAADAISAETLRRIQAIEGRYRLLIAGEMWCPDCQINVTVMDYLQRLQPRVELAVISKGRAEDDLRERLALERILIPVVLVLDGDFQPVGRFIERPQDVVAGGDALKPAYRAGEYLESTLTDLLALFEKAEGRG